MSFNERPSLMRQGSSVRRRASIPHTEEHLEVKPVTERHLDIIGITQLGEGTSGQAFLVQNELDGRRYAVKTVPVHETDAAERTAITNEAAIHADMHHESIVRYCYSWIDRSKGGQDTYFCLLMELCKSDLWSQLESGIPSVEQKRKWTLQLTSGLAHIHGRGVIHRDLNPWNVFVTAEGDAKIGDFGLAARCRAGDMLTGSDTAGAVPLDSSAMGSLYSAPELGKTYSASADVFSLGVTLFCLWALGTLSPTLDDVTDRVEALHDSGLFPDRAQFEAACPLVALLLDMTAAAPERRPSSEAVDRRARELLEVRQDGAANGEAQAASGRSPVCAAGSGPAGAAEAAA